MQVFFRAEEIVGFQKKLAASNKTSGFVPTMGALHDGHLEIVKKSIEDNDYTVVSVFVNPTQFNNAVDLEKYPREVDKDLKKLEQAGADVAFVPAVSEIYGNHVQPDDIDLGGLDELMEGAHRPGHFDGVATVIMRFFDLLKPTRAYFGEKDFQQLQIIRHVSQKHNLGTEVIGFPTQRTEHGLAMSSRNLRLSEAGLHSAVAIYTNLKWAAENYHQYEPNSLKTAMTERFAASDLDLEYVEITDLQKLKPIRAWQDTEHARVFVAAWCEGVRLIDNYGLF